MSDKPWRYELLGLLRHPEQPRLWLVGDRSPARLPRAMPDGPFEYREHHKVSARFAAQLGGRPDVLRYSHFEQDEASRTRRLAYVLDGVAPRGGRWIDHAGLDALADPAQRAIARALLDEFALEIPPQRPPWGRRGWHPAVRRWIDDVVTARDYRVTAPPEQIRAWGISTLLRVPAEPRDLYFKSSARLPLFCDEPRLTAALAERFPGRVPVPLAIEPARGWMLLEDFGGALNDASVEQHAALMADFARLQLASAHDAEWLLASGVIDRRLPWLAGEIEPLLADEATMASLEATERAALRALAPALRERIAALDAFGFPATLVHGDLHPGNVAEREGRFLYFDWTDAALAHPFMELLVIFSRYDQERAPALLDAYLGPLEQLAAPETLREAIRVAAPLIALYHAISYRYLVGALEPRARDELGSATGMWLRRIIDLAAGEHTIMEGRNG